MTNNDDAILQHAEIIVEAVALGQAMLDGDIQEARFRARLTATTADIDGLGYVDRTTGRLVNLLGRGLIAPRPGYGQAIEALSVAIGRTQNARKAAAVARASTEGRRRANGHRLAGVDPPAAGRSS